MGRHLPEPLHFPEVAARAVKPGKFDAVSPSNIAEMVSDLMAAGGPGVMTGSPRSQGGLTPYQQVNSLVHWVYVAVNRIRQGVSKTPLRQYLGDGEEREELTDPDDPLNYLLVNPNPWDTRSEFWSSTITYLELTGNALWLKVRDNLGVVRELWLLPSQYIRPYHSDTQILAGYALDDGIGGAPVAIPKEDVVHLKYPNPKDRFWGLGTLAAAANAMKAVDKIKAHQLESFDNQIAAQMAFVTDQQFQSDDAWRRMMGLIKSRYMDQQRRGVPLLLEAGTKPQWFNRPPAEMDYQGSLQINRDEILSIFGVPPLLAGIVENANNSNTASQETVFGTYTLAPRCVLIQERINKDLVPEFERKDLRQKAKRSVEFDNPTPKDRVLESTIAAQQVQAGILEPNIPRVEAGYEPVEWGEKPRWLYELEAKMAMAPKMTLPPPQDGSAAMQDDEEPEDDPEDMADDAMDDEIVKKKIEHFRTLHRRTLAQRIDLDMERLKAKMVPPLRKLFAEQAKRVKANVERLYSGIFPLSRRWPTALTVREEYVVTALGEAHSRLFPDGTTVHEQTTSGADKPISRLGRFTSIPSCRYEDGQWMHLVIRNLSGTEEENLDDWMGAAEAMAKAMLPRIEAALLAGGGMQADQIGFSGSLALNSPAAEDWLRNKQREYWLGTVQETTKRLLSEKLANVMADAPTLQKMIDVVEEVMEGRIQSSAETIARTESIGAYNGGADLIRQERGVKKKEWVATMDARTRTAHYSADGQIVDQDKTFSVGGAKLRYPGDPQGPVAQIVNCRCTCVAVVDESSLDDIPDAIKPKAPRKPKPLQGMAAWADKSKTVAAYREGTIASGAGDTILGSMVAELGWDGLPEVLSQSQLDERVAKGWKLAYRGMSGMDAIGNSTAAMAMQQAEQFRTGKYYPGWGIYGNGTYAGAGEAGLKVARRYARENGAVIRLALDPKAKVIEYKQLQAKADKAIRKLESDWMEEVDAFDEAIYKADGDDAKQERLRQEFVKKQEKHQAVKEVLATDIGRYAVAEGYDAIYIEDEGYFNILNRTKVAVQADTL